MWRKTALIAFAAGAAAAAGLPGDLPSARFPVGHEPVCLAHADLDGDGRPDIAAGNAGSRDISILYGRDAGAFAPEARVPLGVIPVAIASGDFTGDGRRDLLVVVPAEGAVRVLAGDAALPFVRSASYPAGLWPTAAVVADLDKDGRLDVAVADSGADRVAILLGRAGGGLSPAGGCAVGDFPAAIAAADLDGDGRVDLVTANQGSNDISILHGDGNGAFAETARIAAPGTPSGVCVGDCDRDEVPDIVVSSASSSLIRVFLGAPGSPWTFKYVIEAPAGEAPRGVLLADLDGNGYLDIVTAGTRSGEITVLHGRAEGYGAAIGVSVGGCPYAAAVADFTQDGLLDIACADRDLDSLILVRGAGPRPLRGAVTYGVGIRPRMVRLGDINGDGILDIVTCNRTAHTVSVLLGKGGGSFGDQREYSTGVLPVSVAVGDLDGDGFDDVMTANYLDNDASLLRADGIGALRADDRIPYDPDPNYFRRVTAVCMGDIDHDGCLDGLIAGEWGGIGVFVDAAGGVRTANVYPKGNIMDILLLDVNGDGFVDAPAVGGAYVVDVRLGTPDGTFGLALSAYFPRTTYFMSVAAGDTNGRGSPDLAAVGMTSEGFTEYGTRYDWPLIVGTVQEAGAASSDEGRILLHRRFPSLRSAGSEPSVAIADLDGDGRGEIAMPVWSPVEGTFVMVMDADLQDKYRWYASWEDPSSITAGDLDGDGLADLVVADAGRNTVTVLLTEQFGFRRGDANGDGRATLSDAIVCLRYLFSGGAADCIDAIDVNDDGRADVADAIALLRYMFAGGEAPPRPGLDACGPDPTPDALDCVQYEACLHD